jgi:hypothetical protein
MLVKATYVFNFDVDVSDLNPEAVDIPGLAKDLTYGEVDYLLKHNEITADDFEYCLDSGEE